MHDEHTSSTANRPRSLTRSNALKTFGCMIAMLLIATPAVGCAQSSALDGAPVVLSPGDAIRIIVWRNAELSGEFTIAPDGSITHPLYREIKIAGLPIPQVEER